MLPPGDRSIGAFSLPIVFDFFAVKVSGADEPFNGVAVLLAFVVSGSFFVAVKAGAFDFEIDHAIGKDAVLDFDFTGGAVPTYYV